MPTGEPPSVVTWTASVTSRSELVAVSAVVDVVCTVSERVGDVEPACVVPEGTNVAV